MCATLALDDFDRGLGGMGMNRLQKFLALIAAENLVNAPTSSSSNQFNQFSAASSALLHSATGSFGFQDITNALGQINGSSRTNVQSGSRRTDNSIRVRMGGTLSADFPNQKIYVMQSRSYNVTVLLLAPVDWDVVDQKRTIHVVKVPRGRVSTAPSDGSCGP
jgi:hypothetical protein